MEEPGAEKNEGYWQEYTSFYVKPLWQWTHDNKKESKKHQAKQYVLYFTDRQKDRRRKRDVWVRNTVHRLTLYSSLELFLFP